MIHRWPRGAFQYKIKYSIILTPSKGPQTWRFGQHVFLQKTINCIIRNIYWNTKRRQIYIDNWFVDVFVNHAPITDRCLTALVYCVFYVQLTSLKRTCYWHIQAIAMSCFNPLVAHSCTPLLLHSFIHLVICILFSYSFIHLFIASFIFFSVLLIRGNTVFRISPCMSAVRYTAGRTDVPRK